MIDNISEVQNCWSGTVNGASWTLLQGDAYHALKTLESESIDCIVTSPPYYSLRNYNHEGQIGLEETVPEYIRALTNVMDEVQRVLKKSGVLFLNMGDTYYSGKGASHGIDAKSKKRRFGIRAVDKSGGVGIGVQRKSLIGIPWRVAIAMEERKWVLRSSIIWHRTACLPEAVRDRPRRSHENIFMFVKDRKYHFNRQPLLDKNIDEDVWTIAPRTKAADKIDTAPFPDELVQRCLEIGCIEEGVVLDCFAGSGTTLRVALQTGRSTIGIELNSDYCQYIVDDLGNDLCF